MVARERLEAVSHGTARSLCIPCSFSEPSTLLSHPDSRDDTFGPRKRCERIAKPEEPTWLDRAAVVPLPHARWCLQSEMSQCRKLRGEHPRIDSDMLMIVKFEACKTQPVDVCWTPPCGAQPSRQSSRTPTVQSARIWQLAVDDSKGGKTSFVSCSPCVHVSQVSSVSRSRRCHGS